MSLARSILLAALTLFGLGLASAAGPAKKDKPLDHWLTQLKEGDAKEREEAAVALGSRLESGLPRPADEDAVVAGLLGAATDPAAEIRREAVFALARLRPEAKAGLAALEKASGAADAARRFAAHLALWRLTKKEAHRVAVAEALKDKSPQVRRDAVQFLWTSLVNDRKPLTELIGFLKDPDLDVRREALHGLSMQCTLRGGDAKEAVPALLGLLSDVDPAQREEAARALAGIGPEAKAARTALVKALEDADSNVAATVAFALGQIGDDGETVVPALAKALFSKGRGRMEAAYALGRIGPAAKAATPALEKASESKSPNARVAARLALWRTTGDEKFLRTALAEAVDDGVAANAISWLAGLREPAVPVMIQTLKHPDAKMRDLAMDVLAIMHPQPKIVVPALMDALKDPDPQVRQWVGNALRKVDPEAAKKAGLK